MPKQKNVPGGKEYLRHNLSTPKTKHEGSEYLRHITPEAQSHLNEVPKHLDPESQQDIYALADKQGVPVHEVVHGLIVAGLAQSRTEQN